MRDLLKDFLFSKGYFVREHDADKRHVELQPPVVIASLAKLFNIRVAANPDWANVDMVTVAKRNLGVHIPPPFYRGFPFSVYELLGELALVFANADRVFDAAENAGR